MVIIFSYIVQGIIFGIATYKVIENKGYYENWFWWGFFFGFIALIVALSKPDVHYRNNTYDEVIGKTAEAIRTKDILASGGWRCSFCNSLNAFNVTSCSCGRNQDESKQHRKDLARLQQERTAKANGYKETSSNKEMNNIELIAKYKELLDAGAITQEEFEKKKQTLL